MSGIGERKEGKKREKWKTIIYLGALTTKIRKKLPETIHGIEHKEGGALKKLGLRDPSKRGNPKKGSSK